MNESSPGFVESILLESLPIIKTIAWRDERKPIFMAVCTLLHTKYIFIKFSCFTSI